MIVTLQAERCFEAIFWQFRVVVRLICNRGTITFSELNFVLSATSQDWKHVLGLFYIFPKFAVSRCEVNGFFMFNLSCSGSKSVRGTSSQCDHICFVERKKFL